MRTCAARRRAHADARSRRRAHARATYPQARPYLREPLVDFVVVDTVRQLPRRLERVVQPPRKNLTAQAQSALPVKLHNAIATERFGHGCAATCCRCHAIRTAMRCDAVRAQRGQADGNRFAFLSSHFIIRHRRVGRNRRYLGKAILLDKARDLIAIPIIHILQLQRKRHVAFQLSCATAPTVAHCTVEALTAEGLRSRQETPTSASAVRR